MLCLISAGPFLIGETLLITRLKRFYDCNE